MAANYEHNVVPAGDGMVRIVPGPAVLFMNGEPIYRGDPKYPIALKAYQAQQSKNGATK